MRVQCITHKKLSIYQHSLLILGVSIKFRSRNILQKNNSEINETVLCAIESFFHADAVLLFCLEIYSKILPKVRLNTVTMVNHNGIQWNRVPPEIFPKKLSIHISKIFKSLKILSYRARYIRH